MTPIRIPALKGMDSSVVAGMGDSPVTLKNARHSRDGGYRTAPAGRAILSGVTAFQQFSLARYAYYQKASNSFLYDLKTEQSRAYTGVSVFRDVSVYGQWVVGSGAGTGTSYLPKFGSQSIGGDSAPALPPPVTVPGPEEGIYSEVETSAFGLAGEINPIIPNIIMRVKAVRPTGVTFIKTPTSYTDSYLYDGYADFQSGGWQLMMVYFRSKGGTVGTSINPSIVNPAYLNVNFAVMLPAEPTDDAGAPIYGPYGLEFEFENIPDGYEPAFFTATTNNKGTDVSLRPNKDFSISVPLAQYDTIGDWLNGDERVFMAMTAGTPTNPIPDGIALGGTYDAGGGVTLKHVGYARIKNEYAPSGPLIDDEMLYTYLNKPQNVAAPLFLMADYINRYNPVSVRRPVFGTQYAWRRLVANYTEATGKWSPLDLGLIGEERNPPINPFFPVGSRTAVNAARIWVAADYVTKASLYPNLTDRNKATIITRAMNEYAINSASALEPNIRTVYYSEPNSLEFYEQFIVVPFRRSHTVTALASISAGVVVFGNADAVLISGDSLASFRATAVDIPGTICQATVATFRGMLIYANSEGLHMLEGGSTRLLSNPIRREWGNPTSISINEDESTLLVSFSDKPSLHYDLQRNAWAIWDMADLVTSGAVAAHTSHTRHMAVKVLAGQGNIYSMDAPFSGQGSAVWAIDADAPEIRKQFTSVSYRHEGAAQESFLRWKSGNSNVWNLSSTKNDSDDQGITHRINTHANSLRVEISFPEGTVIGGPLSIEIAGAFTESLIKKGT